MVAPNTNTTTRGMHDARHTHAPQGTHRLARQPRTTASKTDSPEKTHGDVTTLFRNFVSILNRLEK